MLAKLLIAVCVAASHGATIKRGENLGHSWNLFRGPNAASHAAYKDKSTRQTGAGGGELSNDLNEMMANFTATMKELESISDMMDQNTGVQNPEEIALIMAEMQKYMVEYETYLYKQDAMNKKRNAGPPEVLDISTMANHGDLFDMSLMVLEMEGMKDSLTAAMKELENMSSMMIALQMGDPSNSPFDMAQVLGEIDNTMANYTAAMKDIDAILLAMKNGEGLSPDILQQLSMQYGGASRTRKDSSNEVVQKRYDDMTGYDVEIPDFSSLFGQEPPDFSSWDFSDMFRHKSPDFSSPDGPKISEDSRNPTGMDFGLGLDHMLSGLDDMMTNFSQSMEIWNNIGKQVNETTPIEVTYHGQIPSVASEDSFVQELEQIKGRVEVLEDDVADLKDKNEDTLMGQQAIWKAMNPVSDHL